MELTPKTRKEVFLAAAGGQDVTTPTPVTREEMFLDAIAKGGGGGGGYSLPSTETASAGDVLSLDENKEPQWATPSGGGGVLVVNMVYDEEKDTDYTDKTWKEIHDAPMAVIVQEIALSGRTMKTIGSVTQAEHRDSEYSVSCYVLSPMDEITVSNLVTDSENGYLTWE